MKVSVPVSEEEKARKVLALQLILQTASTNPELARTLLNNLNVSMKETEPPINDNSDR